jgi:sulfur carrier protein
MKLIVNGDPKSFSGETLADLLAGLNLAPGRLACEVNGAVVRRAAYASTRLRENDTVEIVQMIGGG